jgi:integrase/recombinase XerD
MDLTTFKEWMLVNGASQASAKTHCDKVASFFRQYEAFTQENLNSYLASKLDKWVANSYNLNINAFSHYAKFLKMAIEIPKYHKNDKKRVKAYISDKEFFDIVSKIPIIFEKSDKTQAIAILMFSTGLRPKEIVQLKREDFNFDEKIISIKNTKTHTDRTVVLSNVLCNMLPAIFAQEAEQTNAFNIHHHHLTYIFQRINEMMGLKVRLTPYTIRHCFAHDMIKKGLDLNSLQVMMGHSNPLTTLGYLNVSEKEAQDKVRKLINKRRAK